MCLPGLSEMTDKSRNSKKKKEMQVSCDSCVYYDVIDEDGTLGCVVDIDEDEMVRERTDPHSACPYYRFYDEYKSVQKQN